MAANPSISTGLTFTLKTRHDPFNEHSWKTTEHLLGLTLADALEDAGVPNDDSVQVVLEGSVIPVEMRGLVRVKESRVVNVEPTPGAAVPAAQAAVTAFGIPVSFKAVSLGGALIASAFLWDSRAILNDLFGIGGNRDVADPLRDITLSGRNQAYPYDPVPVVLGRRRFTPPLAMQPHTELGDGNDSYFNTMLAWGHAPMDVTDIQIGTEPLSSFEGTTAQHDFDGDGGIKFAPREDETRLEVSIGTDWHERQTRARAEYITLRFDLVAYSYTTRYEQRGRDGQEYDSPIYTHYAASTTVEVQYRKQGDTTWLNGGSHTFTARTGTYSPFGGFVRPALSASVYISINGGPDPANPNRRLPLEDGIYEVRTRASFTNSQQGTYANSATLTNFYSRLLEVPVQVSGVALSAFRIFVPAGESTSIDQINAIVGQKIIKYQPAQDEWPSESVARNNTAYFGTSTNPADIFRAVLSDSNINARPLPLDFVDDDNLGEWWRFCQAEGFTYTKVVSGRETRQDLLSEIAKAGRALPRMSGGKWGVSINRRKAAPTQLFTPKNSINCSQKIDLPEFPHALRVPFDNEEQDWEADERLVYDDGFAAKADPGNNIEKADRFEVLNIPGVTNKDAVYKLARYVLATMRLRPRYFTLDVAYKHLRSEIGDWVQLGHDVALSAQASGWIKNVVGSVSYGGWAVQNGTYNLDDFEAYDPPDTPEAGLFSAGADDAPLGYEYDGAYASFVIGNAQYVIAAFGDDSKAVRQRTRANSNAAWGDWSNWSADTALFEESDADRVVGLSGLPVLVKLGSANGTPANIKLRQGKQTHGTWGILHDTPTGQVASRQYIFQAYYGARLWVRGVQQPQNPTVDITLDEPVTFVAGRSYSLFVQQTTGRTTTIPVTNPDTRSVSTYVVRATRASGIRTGDAFSFGESVLNCVITGIEPTDEMMATITLMPYAPAVFDAATSIPDYTSNISRPIAPTFTGPPTPAIIGITSDEEALPVDLKGVPTPTIRLTISPGIAPPLNGKVTQPTQTRVEWRPVGGQWTGDVWPASDRVIYIPNVLARVEYELRIRSEDAARGFSRWNETRHRVLGLGAPPSTPNLLEVKTTDGATVLHWTHPNPERDIVGYVARWSPRPGVRNWDRMVDIDVRAAAEDRATPVQSSTGSYALKAIDVTGTLSRNAIYADSAVIGPPVETTIVKTLQESPGFTGTKDQLAVFNNTLELERVTTAADDPTFTERDSQYPDGIDDWPYIDRPAGTVVFRPEGTYTTAVADLGGIFSVVVTEDFVIGSPNTTSTDMSDTDDMSLVSDMSGGAEEGVTTVTTLFRYGNTTTELNAAGWKSLSEESVTARYFQFRVFMSTKSDIVTPVVSTLKWELKAEARRLFGSGIASSATSATTVTFPVAFEQDDIVVTINILNAQSGDYWVIDTESASKFSFSVYNGNSRVVRNISWAADGHGKAGS